MSVCVESYVAKFSKRTGEAKEKSAFSLTGHRLPLHGMPYLRSMWKEIRVLMMKDFQLDFRQRYALFATLLYVVATTYISYLIFRSINDRMTWVALFWIIEVFAAITAATRSFSSEGPQRFWYYAQLVRPTAVVWAKMIYNTALMVSLSTVTFFLFRVLLGDPIADDLQLFVVVILGAVGFATTLTTMSAIASKTNNNATLMSILSIPLLLPLTVTLVTASQNAALGEPWSNNLHLMGVLALLSALSAVLSGVLFPYLWRE